MTLFSTSNRLKHGCLLGLFGLILPLSAQSGAWLVFNSQNAPILEGTVRDILFDDNNGAWLGGEGYLAYFDQGDWTLYTPENSNLPEFHYIKKMLLDSNGGLWIATSGIEWMAPGLIHFDGSDFQVYNTSNSNLPSNRISDMVMDSQGVLWLVTSPTANGGGLTRFDGVEMTTLTTANSGLPKDHLYSLLLDENEVLWIGSSRVNGMLIRYDGNSWQSFPVNQSLFRLRQDPSGDLWAAMDAGTAGQFTGKGWTLYDHSNSPIIGYGVYGIGLDLDGAPWFGTDEALYRLSNGQWTVFDETNTPLNEPWVFEVEQHEDGDMWLGTVNGFALYRPDVDCALCHWVYPLLPEWPEGNLTQMITMINGIQ